MTMVFMIHPTNSLPLCPRKVKHMSIVQLVVEYPFTPAVHSVLVSWYSSVVPSHITSLCENHTCAPDTLCRPWPNSTNLFFCDWNRGWAGVGVEIVQPVAKQDFFLLVFSVPC